MLTCDIGDDHIFSDELAGDACEGNTTLLSGGSFFAKHPLIVLSFDDYREAIKLESCPRRSSYEPTVFSLFAFYEKEPREERPTQDAHCIERSKIAIIPQNHVK